MKLKSISKISFTVLLLNILLLTPGNSDHISSKTNLIAQNQHIYIIPEDFEMGSLFDPLESGNQSRILHTQIEDFITSLVAKKIKREMIDQHSLFFIERDIEENLFLANINIDKYRIGSPKIVGSQAEISIKLFSTNSTYGTVYCIRDFQSKRWVIEDIEIDYRLLSERTSVKKSFLPVPKGMENPLIP